MISVAILTIGDELAQDKRVGISRQTIKHAIWERAPDITGNERQSQRAATLQPRRQSALWDEIGVRVHRRKARPI